MAGKLALYGVINPTPDLIELNKKRQKVYTSVEIDPSFSDTGEAYLVGAGGHR
ncbi:phage capsid scaffolding protein [Proteus mirabilis]|uniref:Phage capsid scaffolding protein n=1 Tax=Proteus mirabilis TaxID=584 RepID=A0A2X2C5V3_PROMI|nr:phage capsid scaffolding protein [Proteus mirabilis]